MAPKKKATIKPKPNTAPAERKVRVRTYRHGLGDCHLLSFTKPDGTLFHLLIDCGVVDVTPNPVPLMSGVARDVASETRQTGGESGLLDLVIATHQHTDHLSGFQQARPVFDRVIMKRLWLAWTEDKANPQGKKVKQELGKALAAVRTAVTRLARQRETAAVTRIKGLLDFVGPVAVKGEETQAILDYLQGRPDVDVAYHKPGALLELPGVPNVRVYVLGPPEDAAALKICNPRKSKKEGYEETSLAADAEGFVAALVPATTVREQERALPFAAVYRRSLAEARKQSFFKDHYGFRKGQGEAWRRIDTTWLENAERLALALDNYTNNTSLALAFEFVDTGDVLLFPGDAQVGSWLSWHDLIWKVKDPGGAARDVRVTDLFARTVFYKVSHHASHNGTLSGLGLEQMTHRDLVAFVPVDRAMSRKKHWDRTLPWNPLLDRLKEVTRGRLVLTDLKETPPIAENLADLSPVERERYENRVTVTKAWVDFSL